MSDGPSKRQTDFDDLQRELSGTGDSRIARFLPEGHSARAEDEKERQRTTDRILSELARRLTDPEYKAAFDAANDAIDHAQSALDIALAENARHMADLEDRAVKLPDGRAVYLRKDGRGETADGEIIPAEVVGGLDIPADAPTIDQYDATRRRRRELGGYAEDVDAARDEVNNPDDPAEQDRLEEIERDMDELRREIESKSTISAEFAVVSAEQAEALELDFGAVLDQRPS